MVIRTVRHAIATDRLPRRLLRCVPGIALCIALALPLYWAQDGAQTLVLRTHGGLSLRTESGRVAFQNVGGAVRIDEAGTGLTVAPTPSVPASFNAGGPISLTAHSPLTFAVNSTSSGDMTATTTETASETGTPLPPPDDDVTVNSGVTVESTGGNVSFTSADGISLQLASVVKSDTGNVSFTAGSGDNDNDASMSLSGSIQAPNGNITITSPGDVCVGSIAASNGTVTITSTSGAITACSGTSLISAASVVLSAAGGIGTSSQPLPTEVSSLAFSNAGGPVAISNTGSLTIAAAGSLTSSSNTGTTTTLTASGPLTFAAGTTSMGTLSATTIETASETGTPLPPPDDDVTVNSGVMVESTGGNVSFTSADGISLQSASVVKSDTGNVSLSAGSGDNDNDASWALNGSLEAPNGTITPQPPSASITTPANGAVYPLGQTVPSSFSCTEGTGGPGIATCLDQNGNPSGTAINTSTTGSQTFTVTATSKDTLTGTASSTYEVGAAFLGFTQPLPEARISQASTIPVKFQLGTYQGSLLSNSVAAALITRVTLSANADSSSPLSTVSCTYNATGKLFQCNLKKPAGIMKGIPYYITAYQQIGTSYVPIPTSANPRTPNPEAISFK